MIRANLILMLVLASLFGPLSCTTADKSTTEDDVLNLEDEGDSSAQADSGGDESLNDEGEDDLEKELSQNEQQTEEAPPQEEKLQAQQEPEQQPQAEPEPAPEEQPVVAEPVPTPEPVVTAPVEPAVQLVEITNIKYMANQNGGTVVIESSGPAVYQTRNNADNHQFVVEVTGATLPSRLKRPYVLKEFDAAFAAINAYQNPGSTTARIVIQMKTGVVHVDPVVQQEGNSLIVIPGSPVLAENDKGETVAENTEKSENEGDGENQSIDMKSAAADNQALGARSLDEFLTGTNRFYGRKISVEVSDQDIRDVLDFIATEAGLNIILSDDVKGRISMKLRDIPWDQALVTIMKAKKLGYVRQGTVVRISSLTTLQEETDTAKRIIDSQRTLAPLRVKVIPVSYASVEDLSKQMMAFLTRGRGQVVIDPRTSSLIITDTEETLEKMARLVKELDIPPAQVMIEGKVVEAQDTFSQTLGLNWSLSGSPFTVAAGRGRGGSDITAFTGLGIANLGTTTTGNLGMAFRIGSFDIIGDLNAALSLAEQDATVKILSSPRIVTINKEKASISQKGQTITIQQIKDNQGVITRTPVATGFSLELNVTPQITNEGSVIMEVEVKREFPGSVADDASQARPINSRNAKTRILVNDGQTAVIGGIYSSDNTTQENGVPWLRNIPVLGWLFKSRVRNETRNELLIFLTPKVLNIKDQNVET